MHNHQIVTVRAQQIRGVFVTETGRLHMQRRGISQREEFFDAQLRISIVRETHDHWILSWGKEADASARYLGDTAKAEVEKRLSEHLGREISIAPEVEAYCYASLGCAAGEREDVFFSPLLYQPSTDTIRHVPTNYCVVAFDDGKFDQMRLDIDRAAAPYLAAVQQATKNGFHSCDTALGDDYCKRRLAWLAGAYIMNAHPAETIKVAALGRDMASIVRLSH